MPYISILNLADNLTKLLDAINLRQVKAIGYTSSTPAILRQGRYLDYVKTKFLKSLIPLVEDKYAQLFNRITGVPLTVRNSEFDNWLDCFGLNLLHRGESLESIIKIYKLIHENPDIDLFIQTNPTYCCPSLITEAMAPKIEELTGIPVVTIEYDGTSGFKNEDIIPYLKFRKIRHRLKGSD